MRNERVSWIDTIRGIGIILVIYGHGLGATPLRYFIYAFHMPLFFFLSGLVFKNGKNKPYLPAFKKDFKRIMIPYFIFAFVSYLFWFSNIPLEKVSLDLLSYQIFGIFYGNGNNHFLAINIVLWFLPNLFIVKQIFWFLSKLPNKYILFFLLIFSIIGYSFSIFFPNLKLPFGLETALNSIVFFGFGYLWKFIPDNLINSIRKYAMPLFAFSILISFVFAMTNFNLYGYQIDLRLNRLSNYFLFYIASLSGILAMIIISLLINKNRILEYLGQNTMILFVWHLIIFSYISKVIFIFLSPEKVIELRNIYLAPIYTILAIVITLSLSTLFRNARKTHGGRLIDNPSSYKP